MIGRRARRGEDAIPFEIIRRRAHRARNLSRPDARKKTRDHAIARDLAFRHLGDGAIDGFVSACHSSGFDLCTQSKDSAYTDPAIDKATIIADLISPAINCFYNVQVVVASHSAQNDIADLKRVWSKRGHSTQLPRLDATLHRVATRAKLDGFAGLQPLNIMFRPPHNWAKRITPRAEPKLGGPSRHLRDLE